MTLMFSVVIVFLVLVLAFVAGRQRRLQHQVADNRQILQSLQDELKALYAGAAGVGTHLARLELHVNSLSDRQEKMDDKRPETQLYSQAIELIQHGVGVDELIKQCGLMREEAELLVRLHGKQALN